MAPLVCLIDDSEDYRSFVEVIFQSFQPDYCLQMFSNGRQAVEQLSTLQSVPSLIILDYQMPELDGLQTLEALRKLDPFQSTPIVIMSSEATETEISHFYNAGANSFVFKSMNNQLINKLLAVCNYWLEVNIQPAR